MGQAGRLGVEQAANPRPPSPHHELFPQANAEPRFVVDHCRQQLMPQQAARFQFRL
jgi:hypothetical protein